MGHPLQLRIPNISSFPILDMSHTFRIQGIPKWWAALLFSVACSLASCITQDVEEDTQRGNFEALWLVLDQHYCFFSEKADEYGLDWNEVRERYKPQISEGMTNRQLFEVLSNMTYELRDGHVNLYASHQTARYGRWFDDYPMNFSDSLNRITLGRTEDYVQS